MGLKFLDGKSWNVDITREERFFCMHLYNLIHTKGIQDFIIFLNKHCLLNLDPKANWELAYEVCFYRDFFFDKIMPNSSYSQKRTFDLALFSDKHNLIIEAKVQQGFDDTQTTLFKSDTVNVRQLTQTDTHLIGLCSSKHKLSTTTKDTFKNNIITWGQLYDNLFQGDNVIYRADSIYGDNGNKSSGKNNLNGHIKGHDLVEMYYKGEQLFIGRTGGINGSTLAKDILSGSWRNHLYETNKTTTIEPNANWFSLEDFVKKLNIG